MGDKRKDLRKIKWVKNFYDEICIKNGYDGEWIFPF